MTEINDDVLRGLAAKLDRLELDEAERAALDGILDRAAAYEPEVEGFGFDAGSLSYSGHVSGSNLSGTSLKLGSSLGFVTRPSLGYEASMGGDGDWRPPPP